MENEYTVKYTKQIYSYKEIEQAVNDYMGICQILVSETSEDIICKFVFSKEANPSVVDEFTNYLIELYCADR